MLFPTSFAFLTSNHWVHTVTSPFITCDRRIPVDGGMILFRFLPRILFLFDVLSEGEMRTFLVGVIAGLSAYKIAPIFARLLVHCRFTGVQLHSSHLEHAPHWQHVCWAHLHFVMVMILLDHYSMLSFVK
jgi:hypothetical protein